MRNLGHTSLRESYRCRPPLIMYHADPVHVRAPGKALISWENHKIEERTHRLSQFDIRETTFVNKYGNTNNFIIIFGSDHFSGREVRGKSSSVTTHSLP